MIITISFKDSFIAQISLSLYVGVHLWNPLFQHCLQDLVEPLAKRFDIPFTKESFKSFTLTVLNEACSEKTILASKIAVQLLYGKDDLVSSYSNYFDDILLLYLFVRFLSLRQLYGNHKLLCMLLHYRLWLSCPQTPPRFATFGCIARRKE